MECSICHIRGAIGYCAECREMVCEECSRTCSACGRLMCMEHRHLTRSGRSICKECRNARKAQHARQYKEAHAKHEHHSTPSAHDTPVSTSFESLAAGSPHSHVSSHDDSGQTPLTPVSVFDDEPAGFMEEEGIQVAPEALSGSGYHAAPLWRQSLYAACLGLAVVIILALISIPTRFLYGIPLVFVLCAWALGYRAIRQAQMPEEYLRASTGPLLGFVAAILAIGHLMQ